MSARGIALMGDASEGRGIAGLMRGANNRGPFDRGARNRGAMPLAGMKSGLWPSRLCPLAPNAIGATP